MDDQTPMISSVVAVSDGVEVEVGLENPVVVNGVVNDTSIDQQNGGGGGGGVDVGVVGNQPPAKRKRGRPKKQENNDGMLRPDFLLVPAEDSSEPPQKRGRGRPKGSRNSQLAADSCYSLGANSPQVGITGSNFTPSVVNLPTGEDIHQTLRLYSQRTADSLCIIAASGSISSAVIHHPGAQGGTVRYEGSFNIVSLNGMQIYNEQGPRHGKICTLSVQMANQEGQMLAGVVVGPLIAAGPVQLVIGTFREQMMMRHRVDRPKPKKPVVAAVPLQAVNGSSLPVPGVNGVPPVPAPMVEEAGKLIDGPDVIAASQQHAPPVDESDEAMNGPDVNPALTHHQLQAPPADDVYRVETGPDHAIPASPQTADWNSLQPSMINDQDLVVSTSLKQ